MTGHRLPDGFEPTTTWYEQLGITELPRGGYGKDSQGVWCVVTPNGRYGSIRSHTVTEHEDGTITVSPSILIYPIAPRTYGADEREQLLTHVSEEDVQKWERGTPGWHGFLERGVWREC